MIKSLWIKYKSVIMYLVFGVFTTVANIVSFYFCTRWFKMNTVMGTVLAWFGSVLFAYVTNRRWVFDSKKDTWMGVMSELLSFFSCRLLTGALDILIMFLFVDILQFHDMFIKIFSNVIVIVLNYIGSKMFVFKMK